MNPTKVFDSMDVAVDHVLATVAGDVVLGIPLGVGKPNPFVNALYQRIKSDGVRRLRIITALSLEIPVGHSDLERHFLGPLVERVFADYPDLDYVKDSRAQTLPPNIDVSEFFMKTGDYIGNDEAQRAYISTNYTFVARDMLGQGMNVMAQAVAQRQEHGSTHYSLSSNPDVTFEVKERYKAAGLPLLTIGVVNDRMPFMPNGAEVPEDFFSVVVKDPLCTHTVFAPPNNKVGVADYAIGLHASSLVADGGTLQIGIGSLGDAIGQALIVRNQHQAEYRAMLHSLCPEGLSGRELTPLVEGLYGCSEMFVNGFLKLIEAGIVKREVFADQCLQTLVNEGHIAPKRLDPSVLTALLEAGRIRSPLSAADLGFLKRFGIFKPDAFLDGSTLGLGELRLPNQLDDHANFAAIANHFLGDHLTNGVFMTGGFFLGPGDFYETLRTMAPEVLAKIDMTRIDFINQLYGQADLKSAQRIKARLMNTTMIMTLLGAAASDALESGQVVSGVGGQYNFVAMAHALPDARLLMMLRSTHDNKDGLRSSIVWSYGNVTIPRHLRDIVVTEYGVADLRGQSDSEVVKRMLAVADSRFQDDLMGQAKEHGKLEPEYEIPAQYRNNLPEALAHTLKPWVDSQLLSDFPFGTDLTPDELHMVRAMKKIKHASENPQELVALAVKSLWEGQEIPSAYLERLGLDQAHSFKDLLIRRLFTVTL
jgi:acyl-CoA hydrolase